MVILVLRNPKRFRSRPFQTSWHHCISWRYRSYSSPKVPTSTTTILTTWKTHHICLTTEKGEGHDVMWSHVFFSQGHWWVRVSPGHAKSKQPHAFEEYIRMEIQKNGGDLSHFETLTVLTDHTWSPYPTNESLIHTLPRFEVTGLPPEKNDCLEDPFNVPFEMQFGRFFSGLNTSPKKRSPIIPQPSHWGWEMTCHFDEFVGVW